MNRITILICGKASSGKTTFATVLAQEINKVKEMAKVIHNAQTVKTLAESFFHWEKDEKGRQLLIDLTNSGYNYDPIFWERETERLFRNYQKFCNEDLEILIVPDWRYMSTYEYFSNVGKVITVMVERHDVEKGTHDFHSSENDFKKFPTKYHILNDSESIEDLERFSRMLIEVEGLQNV